ncbi:MAG: hypothetical protein WC785_10075 [Tatlockia sp.]|jgi:hypothetical protein
MKLFSKGRYHFLQPLAYMVKDGIDTFKPYKSPYYIKRDLFQPFHGVANLSNGLKNIGSGIICFAKGEFATGTGRVAYGLTNILRGVTRILTTPLTWVLRMPFRGMRTLFSGFREFKPNSKMIKQAGELKDVLDGAYGHLSSICKEKSNVKMQEFQDAMTDAKTIQTDIIEKYNKVRARGQTIPNTNLYQTTMKYAHVDQTLLLKIYFFANSRSGGNTLSSQSATPPCDPPQMSTDPSI